MGVHKLVLTVAVLVVSRTAFASATCSDFRNCQQCFNDPACTWCGVTQRKLDGGTRYIPTPADLPLGECVDDTGTDSCDGVTFGTAKELLELTGDMYSISQFDSSDSTCTNTNTPGEFLFPDCASCTAAGNGWCLIFLISQQLGGFHTQIGMCMPPDVTVWTCGEIPAEDACEAWAGFFRFRLSEPRLEIVQSFITDSFECVNVDPIFLALKQPQNDKQDISPDQQQPELPPAQQPELPLGQRPGLPLDQQPEQQLPTVPAGKSNKNLPAEKKKARDAKRNLKEKIASKNNVEKRDRTQLLSKQVSENWVEKTKRILNWHL